MATTLSSAVLLAAAKKWRHDAIVTLLCELASNAALPVRREPRHLLVIEGGLKSGDLVIDGFSPGFRMSAFDVTVKDTLQSTTLSHAAVSSGHVAGVGHDAKLAKYLRRCHAVNVEFTPLAWETSGGATDTVHSFLKRLTRLQADPDCCRSGDPSINWGFTVGFP
jgi:hypothetical protein